ncbi:hypothetical protein BV20DRAFT_857620 [Pilatotrama ljubarskyi]|nr:hypothetical protein BV20DRAFT_857620 [Pilatotrama ljubarskyi]
MLGPSAASPQPSEAKRTGCSLQWRLESPCHTDVGGSTRATPRCARLAVSRGGVRYVVLLCVYHRWVCCT